MPKFAFEDVTSAGLEMLQKAVKRGWADDYKISAGSKLYGEGYLDVSRQFGPIRWVPTAKAHALVSRAQAAGVLPATINK
jgi:hypothetical protein